MRVTKRSIMNLFEALTMNKNPIPAEVARRIWSYSPDTGEIVYLVPRGNAQIGDRAGHYDGNKGYRRVRVFGHYIGEHRLAWLLYYGEWPLEQLDHINGIKDDNRICNLRPASNSQNAVNKPARNDNKLGVKGVFYEKNMTRIKRYRAVIKINGKQKSLGYFLTVDEAKEAYKKAALQNYGEYAWGVGY
jgi:hypothetical protein